MKILEAYAIFGLKIEGSVLPIPCGSIKVTVGLLFDIFFGILVRQGTVLGQDLSDMIHFFCYLLITKLLSLSTLLIL